MLERIKKYRISIFILGGVAFHLLFVLFVKIYRIPAENNLAALIGISLTEIPICIGLILYGNKIRRDKKGWSVFVKAIAVLLLFALAVVSIALFIFHSPSAYMGIGV